MSKAKLQIDPCNPHGLRHGEVLPLIGGPHDGEASKVSLMFGRVPSSGVVFGDDLYLLDQAGRRWVYDGKVKDVRNASVAAGEKEKE